MFANFVAITLAAQLTVSFSPSLNMAGRFVGPYAAYTMHVGADGRAAITWNDGSHMSALFTEEVHNNATDSQTLLGHVVAAASSPSAVPRALPGDFVSLNAMPNSTHEVWVHDASGNLRWAGLLCGQGYNLERNQQLWPNSRGCSLVSLTTLP